LRQNRWHFSSFLTLVVCGSLPACFAGGEKFPPPPVQSQSPTVFLQGGVQTIERLPAYCPGINGFGTYQQAWYALGQKQYKLAAQNFQIAGDQMEASAGETRYLAEARFAEAQTRKLMGQYDRAADLYKRSIEVFERTDPRSYYLQVAREAQKEMLKMQLKGQVKQNKAVLKAMPVPDIEKVGSEVQLSSRVTELDNGVAINTLHNADFFNRSRGMLPQAAGVDLSDDYVKKVVYQAVLKMNCMETAAIGATNYTAPMFYKPIMADGKPMVVGTGSSMLSPTAELKLNGKNYKVPMDLPHISPNSRNVMLVTDDRHVLAIDPRTSEAWKLSANLSKKLPEFSWWKLGRQKGRKFS
jgi:hypothetical protein